MATNKYIGSRYVPKYFGTWSSTTEYEALSIVSDSKGEYTYTSKRPVPVGTLLSNVEYWAPSGRLSESMEIGIISHVDSTKADNATIAANKLNLTFANDYTMNDSTKASINLNTTVQSGTYGINPSLCQNVPDDLKLSADTVQLFVYVVGANTYTQSIVAPKAGGFYVRISVNDQWSEWVSVGGATIAYATKANAGLVQLGDGLKSENATGLTSIDHDATLDMTASNKLTVAVGEHMETDGSGRIDPMVANTAQAGIVQVGSGISVSNGTISVPKATTSAAGSVQIGNGLNVANGVVSVPNATQNTSGIVKIGNNINVTSGVISIPLATTENAGVVRIGNGISVSNGEISADVSATKIGDGSSSADGVYLSSYKCGSTGHIVGTVNAPSGSSGRYSISGFVLTIPEPINSKNSLPISGTITNSNGDMGVISTYTRGTNSISVVRIYLLTSASDYTFNVNISYPCK